MSIRSVRWENEASPDPSSFILLCWTVPQLVTQTFLKKLSDKRCPLRSGGIEIQTDFTYFNPFTYTSNMYSRRHWNIYMEYIYKTKYTIWKHCDLRRNCSSWAIPAFVTIYFQKPSAAEASESVYMWLMLMFWISAQLISEPNKFIT